MPSKPPEGSFQALKPKVKFGNLQRVRTLEYVRDIENRVDGRSALGIGLRDHEIKLLTLFDVRDSSELDTLEYETLRRLKKRRVIRELSWGRVQRAAETDDLDAFNAEVPRFQHAVDCEERTEEKLRVLLAERRARMDREHDPIREYVQSEEFQRSRTTKNHDDHEVTADGE